MMNNAPGGREGGEACLKRIWEEEEKKSYKTNRKNKEMERGAQGCREISKIETDMRRVRKMTMAGNFRFDVRN